MENNTVLELIAYNSEMKNILKVVEECSELSEVMTKLITKREDLRPSKEKIAEEMGDVLFRIKVAAEMLGLTQAVEDRQDEKAAQVQAYINEHKYKGGA